MEQTFSFKPALLGARWEVRVSETGVDATRGAKRQSARFADVTEARLVEIYMRTSSVSLVLLHRTGKFAINYGGRVSEAASNPDAAGFVAASAAILDGLARTQPDFEVRLGGGAGLRWTMAILGAAMAALGVLLALIPFGQGGVAGEGVVVVITAMLVAFGGIGLAWRYNPFKPLPRVKASELAGLFSQYLAAAA